MPYAFSFWSSTSGIVRFKEFLTLGPEYIEKLSLPIGPSDRGDAEFEKYYQKHNIKRASAQVRSHDDITCHDGETLKEILRAYWMYGTDESISTIFTNLSLIDTLSNRTKGRDALVVDRFPSLKKNPQDAEIECAAADKSKDVNAKLKEAIKRFIKNPQHPPLDQDENDKHGASILTRENDKIKIAAGLERLKRQEEMIVLCDWDSCASPDKKDTAACEYHIATVAYDFDSKTYLHRFRYVTEESYSPTVDQDSSQATHTIIDDNQDNLIEMMLYHVLEKELEHQRGLTTEEINAFIEELIKARKNLKDADSSYHKQELTHGPIPYLISRIANNEGSDPSVTKIHRQLTKDGDQLQKVLKELDWTKCRTHIRLIQASKGRARELGEASESSQEKSIEEVITALDEVYETGTGSKADTESKDGDNKHLAYINACLHFSNEDAKEAAYREARHLSQVKLRTLDGVLDCLSELKKTGGNDCLIGRLYEAVKSYPSYNERDRKLIDIFDEHKKKSA